MAHESLIRFICDTHPVPPHKAEEIATHFNIAHFVKNDFLLREGKTCSDYLFLEDGYIRAFTYDTDGNEVITGLYAPGQVVFECASFFLRVPSTEHMQAITDIRGWQITFDQLQYLFHAIPEFSEFGRAVLVKGFTALKLRMLSAINETAEKRYAHLLNTRPKLFQNVPLKNIASYLGITDTSLSRIRKEYANK